MSSRLSLSAGLVLVVLVAGCAWWLWSATPTASAVEALRTPVVPVPEPNLTILDEASFTNRVIYGTLPILVDATTLGRDDPFAGTE